MKKDEFDKLVKEMIQADLKFLQENTIEGAMMKGEDIVTEGGGEDWHCKKCKAAIEGFRIAFAVHDGFSLLGTHAGSGSCSYVVRPHCPNCNPEAGNPGFPEVPSLGYKFSGGCIDI